MNPRQLRRSLGARRDVDAALDYYRVNAGRDTALRFVAAIETAYRSIARQPGLGSPFHAQTTGIAGLRHRVVRGFPYLIFYVDRGARIEVIRVLHVRRDLADLLDERDAGDA